MGEGTVVEVNESVGDDDSITIESVIDEDAVAKAEQLAREEELKAKLEAIKISKSRYFNTNSELSIKFHKMPPRPEPEEIKDEKPSKIGSKGNSKSP